MERRLHEAGVADVVQTHQAKGFRTRRGLIWGVIVKLIIVLNVRIWCFSEASGIVDMGVSLGAPVVRISPRHAAHLVLALFCLLDSILVRHPVLISVDPHLVLYILQSIILGVGVFFLCVLVVISFEVFDVLGDGVGGLGWRFDVGVAEPALGHGYA